MSWQELIKVEAMNLKVTATACGVFVEINGVVWW
jgi:hypothetical protein